ncbi:MAG: preprotein translocase subunit SecE [Lachnospiraceae bacterium]|jgi:preprotein translocase subunit SecE|nr:preprotein translocase subunit SecE [Lachnospiraceae bacterium]
MADSKEKAKKPGFFRGVRREFKKITWPSKNDAFKQTVVVSIITVVTGVLIGLIDLLVKYGLSFITK